MIEFRRLRNLFSASARSRQSSRRSTQELPAVLWIGGTDAAAAQAESPDWRFVTVKTLADARELPVWNQVAIAICDREAAGIGWRKAVRTLAEMPSRPCVVLLSTSENSQLWEEVTGMGGYDVIRKPLSVEALSRAIRSGLSQWRSSRALEGAHARIRK